MQTKASLNREEKDTYMVTVTATDPSGLSATVNVTIKVTNVDEDPTLEGTGFSKARREYPQRHRRSDLHCDGRRGRQNRDRH